MSFTKESVQKPKLVLVNVNPAKLSYSKIIKSSELDSVASTAIRIEGFVPREVVGKIAPVLPSVRPSNSRLALDGLKQNLKTLTDLHAKLHFMLTELEDLAK